MILDQDSSVLGLAEAIRSTSRQVSFTSETFCQFDNAVQKLAVLVSNEFEGFTRNGGIGTYYTTLSQKLAADDWTVILLLCQVEDAPMSQRHWVHHVFFTHDISRTLVLQPIHQRLLNTVQQADSGNRLDYESLCCLFFIQALTDRFPEAVIYAEFPEIWGFGYRTLQAKQAGLLSHHCLTGVTAHGSFEWLREINSQYQVGDMRWLWQAHHYEQFSYEQADITFSPSHFLKHKVASYGWRTDQVKHLPYFIPVLEQLGSQEELITLDCQPDSIPVIFFGRLEERKGLCTFLAAIKRLDKSTAAKIHIFFVGKVIPLQSSDLAPLNSQQYIERQLGNEFAYSLQSDLSSQAAIAAIARLHCPIVCLTSLQENFPNAALEMGQLPIHLVVSNTGGFHETLELIQRTEAIHWFHPGNAGSLAQGLTQAVQAATEKSQVPSSTTHQQTNQNLLNQRLEYMSQAFLAAAPKDQPSSNVTLILIAQLSDDGLLECLTRLAEQTYQFLDVIVVSFDEGDTQAAQTLTQVQTQFSDYTYLEAEANWSLGTTYNYVVKQAVGNYVLFCPSHLVAAADMIERLVFAAVEAEAVAAVCPQLSFVNEQPQVCLIDGNLLKLLEFEHRHDLIVLFERSFLNTFSYSEERGLLALNWQLFAAAIATDQPIAYYPYPLYALQSPTNAVISATHWPKERYYLRQFLAQIPPGQWHRRQLNVLLTGFEQILQQPQQPPAFSRQDQAWQITAQQLHQELIQVQAQLQTLELWNQQLQTGKDWLEGQWHSWMLSAQKAEFEAAQLRSLVQQIQTSKFWRLRRVWFKLKQQLTSLVADPLLPPANTYTPGVQAFIARMAGQKIRFFQPEATAAPVISIISSCSYGYEYLETTYRSIVNQTMQNFEWLLVKTATTSSDYETLLADLPERTAKIRLLSGEHLLNVAAHYNAAIAEAKGSYLCFVDIGTVLDPTYLEKCILFLESHPQVSFVNSYAIVFQAQEHWWNSQLNLPQTLIQQPGLLSHPVYRIADFLSVGQFDESFGCLADWERLLRAIAAEQLGWTLPEYLDGYRATPDSTPAIALFSSTASQHTLTAIESRYRNSLSSRAATTLMPPPLSLQSLDVQFQISNPRTPDHSNKRILLFCQALDTSEIAKWNCDLAIWLAKCGYDIAIATTSESDHAGQEFFYPATADIFHLPHLLEQAYWLPFMRYLLKARQIDGILISGSPIAYSFLPILQTEFPNVALLGYIASSQQNVTENLHFHIAGQEHSACLDYLLISDDRQVKGYAASRFNAHRKIKVCQTQLEVEATLAEAIQAKQASDKTAADWKEAALELLRELQATATAEPKRPAQTEAEPFAVEPTVRQLLRLLLKKLTKR